MKRVSVPILILLIATQAFSKWVMLLEYEWNKDYIAANLCKNKAKPKLRCAGKCQLIKRMAQQEKETSTTSQPQKSNFQEVPFSLEETVKGPNVPLSPGHSFSNVYSIEHYTAPPHAIFHPPA